MSTKTDWESQAIALAAVLESAMIVDQLARTGAAPTGEMEALCSALFQFEWEHIGDVFGGTDGLHRGLARLRDLCRQGSTGSAKQVMGYAMSMLYLSDKLGRDKDKLEIIRNRLDHTSHKIEYFDADFDNIAASVSSIYQDTLSQYRYRIQVSGSAEHLQNARTADRVRTLLFAGVRAAMLWRYVGGSRLRFLLNRKRIAAACDTLLDGR